MCSFISFENLPLIEFKVDPKIAHRKVLELLYSDKSKNRKKARKDKYIYIIIYIEMMGGVRLI